MRKSGVLLPVSSLPSRYGIGTLGGGARDFVDFLSHSAQSFWQILPINPTAYGDSPYQSPSAFAGNPYFIDPGELLSEGLLTKSEEQSAVSQGADIDYGRLYETRLELLKKAVGRMNQSPEREQFFHENSFWLEDYALFTALRRDGGMSLSQCLSLTEEQRAQARSRFSRAVFEYKSVQFLFYRQWFNLKKYANNKGVHIIGDIPIYVSEDSADVWSNRRLFLLDRQGHPSVLSGCPPDDFSAEGQLWGNPMYDWSEHEKDGYCWWLKRLAHAQQLFDMVRIDHFRGFFSGWAVPAGSRTAENGCWLPAPGDELIAAVKTALPMLPVIAEDLGFVTNEVRAFFQRSGFPGMKIMQFAFDDPSSLPYTFTENSVVYTGTHDNPTLIQWLCQAERKTLCRAMDYLGVQRVTQLADALIRGAMASPCFLSVIPMGDWLGLGKSGRINTPSTAQGNWRFRLTGKELTEGLAERIHSLTELFGRI